MENMRLFKVTIVLISLLLTSTAIAANKTPGDAKGHIGDMQHLHGWEMISSTACLLSCSDAHSS